MSDPDEHEKLARVGLLRLTREQAWMLRRAFREVYRGASGDGDGIDELYERLDRLEDKFPDSEAPPPALADVLVAFGYAEKLS